MVKDIEAGRAISSSRRNRPDAPLCHGVLHLGCGAYAAVSSQRRPLLGLMHRVHSFLCARYVPPWPALHGLPHPTTRVHAKFTRQHVPTLLTSARYAIFLPSIRFFHYILPSDYSAFPLGAFQTFYLAYESVGRYSSNRMRTHDRVSPFLRYYLRQ